jgi:hypothetical protein
MFACGDSKTTPTQSTQPTANKPADPWHTRAGAGEVVEPGTLITTEPGAGSFTLAAGGAAAPLVVSSQDHAGVVRVVGDLQSDIKKVTGINPTVANDTPSAGASEIVLIGTIGHSPLVDSLVSAGKLDVSKVKGRWETFVIQPVSSPMSGVSRALVVAGSDPRGTIYGVYEISRRIGVSPWYYFDDVPIAHQDALYVNPAPYTLGTPAVKYRGIFINDENPQLGAWGPATFGPGLAPGYSQGFNSKLYAKIFETLLRLRANYLWPAVWGRAFALDDPQNHATATRYGIVMGTSHEAPMMRGIEEWNRNPTAYGGNGAWTFSTNRDAVVAYMKDGIKRMKDQGIEGVVTMGMRGNGDVSLPAGTGVREVQDILDTERQILADVMGPDIADLPKVWTLYHEVQDWYLRPDGIKPADDITIIWADDLWGSMRKLPDQTVNSERYGGYGIYYHYDIVAGPRDYKWVDSNLLENAWEQLNLVYAYGVDRLWVVNVGDFKDMEFPTEFFLDYAWAPDRWPATRISDWREQWAAQQFGAEEGPAIADVLARYEKLQHIRKPELLNQLYGFTKPRFTAAAPTLAITDADPFSLVNYAEHAGLTDAWEALASDADQINAKLPAAYKDAFYELVLYKVKATANLYALRQAQFTAYLYSSQGRAATQDMISLAKACFQTDQDLNTYYNTQVASGKWAGWATQPHIGYSGWQEPENGSGWASADFIYPSVDYALGSTTVPLAPTLASGASMGVAIDGTTLVWPGASGTPTLPTFSPYQTQSDQYIDVFNKGSTSFDVTVSLPDAYKTIVTVSPASTTVAKEVRVTLQIDWTGASAGTVTVPITITGSEGTTVIVNAVLDNRPIQVDGNTVLLDTLDGFVEANGYVSILADHYTKAVGGDGITWLRIPDGGQVGSAMTVLRRNAPVQTPADGTPNLEYQIYLADRGQDSPKVDVWTYLSARNSVRMASGALDGLLYAVSIDDETPQLVNVSTFMSIDPQASGGFGTANWNWMVADNIIRVPTTHTLTKSTNPHVLRYWLVDPTAVVQKFVVDTGDLRPSYLGPPESCVAPGPCR